MMNRLAKEAENLAYGAHRSRITMVECCGLRDANGWFPVRDLVGIEWSAQFSADPAKVDLLRQNPRRLYAAFPDAVEELGIRELLDAPITDAEGMSRWADSICNASLPLPAAFHHPAGLAGGALAGLTPPEADPTILPADHPLSRLAFIRQTG
jgi:hypothetical protein